MKRILENTPLMAYLLMALCGVMAVAFAAGVYGGIAGRASDGMDIRTAGQFVEMKTRQAANASDILCDGSGTAVFLEHGDFETFEDRVYAYDGWLMELYTDADAVAYYGADEESGDRLVPCGGLGFTYDGNLLEFGVDVAGRHVSGAVLSRGGAR